MYRPRYYTIHELAHPRIIRAIGKANTWLRLDADVLWDLDYIRSSWAVEHGSGIFVNRLHHGLDSRGLRPPDDGDGSFWSVHKQGKAFDLEPVNGMHEKLWRHVHKLIRNGRLKKVNTLEDLDYTPTWVHVANMNTDMRPLIITP